MTRTSYFSKVVHLNVINVEDHVTGQSQTLHRRLYCVKDTTFSEVMVNHESYHQSPLPPLHPG